MSNASNPPQNTRTDAPPSVSVIIPVYKAEAYVADAMECLLHQTLREMEFIFVDDCGGDGSEEMIRRHAERDPRILLLCNDCNRGAGFSRNRGIEAAHGKYIAFFDIDDSCDPDFYGALYRLAEKTDAMICKGTLTDVYEDGRQLPSGINDGIRRDLAEGYSLYSTFVFEHSTALYRRDWVVRTGACNGTSSQGEDTFFLLQVCQGADGRFTCTDEVHYHYRHRGTSASGVHDERFLRNQIAHRREKLAYVNNAGLGGKSYLKYCARLLDTFAHHFLLEALLGAQGMDFYNEFAGEVGNFASDIKNVQGLAPYLSSAGSIAVLRALADGDPASPWGKRFIAALLQNQDATVNAIPSPRLAGAVGKLKRLVANCAFALIGLDRSDRWRLWTLLLKR